MKTTVELPDKLVREIKLRAVEDGRKLNDVLAELITRGFGAGGYSSKIVRVDRSLLKQRRKLINRFVRTQL